MESRPGNGVTRIGSLPDDHSGFVCEDGSGKTSENSEAPLRKPFRAGVRVSEAAAEGLAKTVA